MGSFRVVSACLLVLAGFVSASWGGYAVCWAIFAHVDLVVRLRAVLQGAVGVWAAVYLVSFAGPLVADSSWGRLLGVLGSGNAAKWLMNAYLILITCAFFLLLTGEGILMLVFIIVTGYVLFVVHETAFGAGKRRREAEALDNKIAFYEGRERWDDVWKLRSPAFKADPILAEVFAGYAIVASKEIVPTLEPLVNETLAERNLNGRERGYLLFARGSCLCHQGRMDEGKQCFSEALEMMREVSDKVAICESVAMLVIRQRLLDLLAEVDRYSLLALEVQPEVNTLKGTRGSILIEMGRVGEGVAMLEEVFRDADTTTDKAICAFYLALASLQKGDEAGTRMWCEQLMQFGPSQWLVERAVETGVQPTDDP